ncbi:MAG: glycine cleavage system aminomethyltransferase GcvT [Bdellovibrionales bacterium]|nr:glycine cleavage system aminomethyltransferase GcvT [Bdellovibrionales bacterium]
MTLKSTPLKEQHIALGAKMVDFAGWYMPVQYAGLREEHVACRAGVGLFDVSHMGEVRIRGPKALEAVEWLTSNYAGKLENGQAQYSLLTNAQGGIVDDLIVYCVEKGHDYLLCVNASNTEKDFAWMKANNRFSAEMVNESEQWGQIAVQGPKAIQLATRVLGAEVEGIPSFEFRRMAFKNGHVLVARTGYTGEDGVEVFVPADLTSQLWSELMQRGSDLGVVPVGLGARDTLRTEMKYPLYGHEIDDTTNPYSAGLGWVVKPDKKDFIGRDKIVAGKEKALQRKLVGFKMVERGIPRQGYKLFALDGRETGFVTSGTPSPSLNDNIGVGYVARELSETGQRLNVEIRGRMVQAEVVPTPFVNRK